MMDLEWVIHKFCIMDNVYLFSQNCTAIIEYFPNIYFPVFKDIISIQCDNIITESKNLSGVGEKLNILCRFNERPKL